MSKTGLYMPGVRRLCLAIVLQAFDDLRADPGNNTLREWLLVDGLFILEGFGHPIDPPKYEAFILAGCPGRHLARHNR